MLRSNRRGAALPGWSLLCAQLKRYHDPATSYRNIIPQQFHMQHMGRETWNAAGQASRQPQRSSASRMKLAMRTAQGYHDPTISQHRKSYPSSFKFSRYRASAGRELPRPKSALSSCVRALSSSFSASLAPGTTTTTGCCLASAFSVRSESTLPRNSSAAALRRFGSGGVRLARGELMRSRGVFWPCRRGGGCARSVLRHELGYRRRQPAWPAGG